ncbi:androgen-dependent TFPI-regulating protein-like [Zootermopsis nevadensis]|uniref:androgen-dependent TFPI-regulating protein-like n=1 Tax=Zootermopsis nevadensis TaxID=136037 RepID=UPI000B8ED61E|nr:androgen-dependent TFPI-regulating protein-like [Zootermopsis nevadensis]
MLLEAFHLLVSLHHYTTVHLLTVNYAGATDRYLTVMRDMGFRYFTVWNLIMQCVYFSACTGEHALRAVTGNDLPLLRRWQKLRESLFQALVFPTGLVVFSLFWTIYSYDRSLVYPAIVDEYVAPHVNHFMHTDVAVVVVLEMLLRPHHYHRRGMHLGLLFLYCFSYLTCYLYTYWTRGIWIYPLYYHLSWTQQILMNVVTTFIVPGVCYLLGEAIASALWGETLSCHARVVSNGNNVVN